MSYSETKTYGRKVVKGVIHDYTRFKRLLIAALTSLFIVGFLLGLVAGLTVNIKPTIEDVSISKEPVALKVVATEETSIPYDVPLDKELQVYIQELAERYDIKTEIILAVIGQESNYKSDAVGDGGDSLGLMQVQEKYHQERMKKHNVTDLLNPYENVLIGTDYLAECIQKGGLEWGLMAYNGGASYANTQTTLGVISEYAESVIMLSEIIEKEGEKND